MSLHIISCREAKQKDLVDYLASLGHRPQKISGYDHWYLSPFREEKTSSFKVNSKFNVWYDHGIGKGGNLVDFGILYHRCSVSEFLQKLSGLSSFQQPKILPLAGNQEKKLPGESPAPESENANEKTSRITILSTHEISSHPLVKYLGSRGINPELAGQYCREVRYQTGDKIYYALGFKNDTGGYELRSERFKGSSSPKDVRFIDNAKPLVAVFEGFFSFLSFLQINGEQNPPLTNFLVLNSLSFLDRARALMEKHDTIHLFLDRDLAGLKATGKALQWDKRYIDRSDFYSRHKDLNEWLQANSLSPRITPRQGRHL